MAMNRRASLAVKIWGLLLVVMLATACGDGTSDSANEANTGQPGFPLTITDSSGKALTFSQAPRRIVSYSPGATETLFAIGAGKSVVGVDQFSDYPKETESLPKVDYSRPAPEPALALTPDLVIMATRQEGQVEPFRSVGLNVLFFREPTDVLGVAEDVRLLGRITGRNEEAEAIAKDMERRIAAVSEKVAKVQKGPVVYYELTPEGFTVAPDSFIGSMLRLVKAGNVAEGSTTPFPQLSVEVILKASPELILLADAGAAGGQSLATVRARPGWSSIRAVQTGRVYELDANAFSRPGPRIVDALEMLAKLLYPEL